MRARLLAAAAVVGATLAGASIAVARGTLFSDTGALASSSSSGGGGGLAIGAPITGGTATRVLHEGAGGTLADSATFYVADNTQLRQLWVEGAGSIATQIRARNTSTLQWASTGAYALNDANAYAGLQVMSSTTPGDWNGILWHDQPMLTLASPNATDATVRVNTGGGLHFLFGNPSGGPNIDRESFRMARGEHRSLVDFYAGSEGQGRWFHVDGNGYLVEVDGVATSFRKGRCTLDGSSPSQCAVTLPNVPSGSSPVCTCTNEGTTENAAKKGCAVNVSGTTVTVTAENGATTSVAVLCW